MKTAFSGIIAFSLALAALPALCADKLVVEDFADCGTWRTCKLVNTKPDAWFAYSNCLSGGFADAARPDSFAGRISYSFQEGGGELQFLRAKAARPLMDMIDGLEFQLLSERKSSFSFVVGDAKGKLFYSKSGDFEPSSSWRACRIPFDKSSVKGFEGIVWPVKLMRLCFKTQAESGELGIDDIAFTGKVAKQDVLAIKPLLRGIVSEPGKAQALQYRIFNAADVQVQGKLSIVAKDFSGNEAFKDSQALDLAPCSSSVESFSLPPLSLGSYSLELKIAGASGAEASLLDWLAVFEPNNGRLNEQKMWFGVQDVDCWNGPAETLRHHEWMKALGPDIVRFGISGGRLDPSGSAAGFAPVKELLKRYEDSGTLVCLSYTEGVPARCFNGKEIHRKLPDNQEEFKAHLERVFSSLKQCPNVKYFEWWNEPDIGFLNAGIDEYLASLKTVYETGKSVAPGILITTGGSCVIHPREKQGFSKDMYQKGRDYYDIASFHAHGPQANYVERQRKLESWQAEAGLDRPYCNTESGMASGYSIDSIKYQAATLVKKIVYAKSRNTEFYIWFTLQDYWDMDFEADDSYGLVTSDNAPKPSFPAYAQLIRRLSNTGRGEAVELGGAIEAYKFLSKDGALETLACWPRVSDTKPALALKGKGEAKLYDIFGAERMLQAESGFLLVPLNGSPCYLSYPAGSFSPCEPLAAQTGFSASYAGGKSEVKLALFNQFQEAAEYALSVKGETPVSAKLQPGERITVSTSVSLPKNAKGVYAAKGSLKIQTPTRSISQEIPLCVNVCYPVGSGSPASSIQLDSLLSVQELSFDPQIPRWGGKDDLSAAFSAWRDGATLKIKVDVTDDKHIMEHKPQEAWRDDSLQIAFASDKGAETLLTVSGSGESCFVWRHKSIDKGPEALWDLKSSFRREGVHSIYEFELPLAEIGVQPLPGSCFRFSFLVNENDGLGRVRWIEYGGGIGRGFNPDEFKWALLK